MDRNSKIYVAGHRGLVGSAIIRRLAVGGYTNIITRNHDQLDLTRQTAVEDFFLAEKPDYVFLAAAKVGGIMANSTYPADFIYQNIVIATNVVEAARKSAVRKLMNLGSSCIFPKLAPQPMKEEYLLSGYLEGTNEAYAVAKIAAIKLCRYYNEQYGTNFLSVMPTNLYGPGDNFDAVNSHVLPALIRKFHEAKTSGVNMVELWGDGSPYREFLHSDDLADAVVFLMERYDYKDTGEFVNIGSGLELTIRELAEKIRGIVFGSQESCRIQWDTSKPNGTPRKLLDVSRLAALGWKAKISLDEGLARSYKDYVRGKNALN